MTRILPPRLSSDHDRRFIGLDLAKKETQMVCLDSAGKRIGTLRFASTSQNFSQLAGELTPYDSVAMEVTTNTFTIARILQVSGARVTISDPIKTRVIAEAKIKTDKIDARVLAELDRVDYLPKVWLPDPDTEELRHFMSDSSVAGPSEDRTQESGTRYRASVDDLRGLQQLRPVRGNRAPHTQTVHRRQQGLRG